jgi:hypothetical protein
MTAFRRCGFPVLRALRKGSRCPVFWPPDGGDPCDPWSVDSAREHLRTLPGVGASIPGCRRRRVVLSVDPASRVFRMRFIPAWNTLHAVTRSLSSDAGAPHTGGGAAEPVLGRDLAAGGRPSPSVAVVATALGLMCRWPRRPSVERDRRRRGRRGGADVFCYLGRPVPRRVQTPVHSRCRRVRVGDFAQAGEGLTEPRHAPAPDVRGPSPLTSP